MSEQEQAASGPAVPARVLSPEGFFEYLEQAQFYSVKGKARLNILRNFYRAYCEAYREDSLLRLCQMASTSSLYVAVWKAAEDRDAGLPGILVQELE